jgi:hypothetical protein
MIVLFFYKDPHSQWVKDSTTGTTTHEIMQILLGKAMGSSRSYGYHKDRTRAEQARISMILSP